VFDIGFTELMLIGIVALVVIGPERLPAVAKTAGQWLAKLQRFVRGVKTDLASELETGDLKKLLGDQREQINELKNMVTTVKKDFETSSQTIVKDAKSKFDDMETSAKESEDSSSSQSTAQVTTASPAAAATLSASSAESIDKVGLGEAADTQREFETLDGQTVSIDKTDDTSDIGRTGS
jgi:sec-independent protein translocase protein TatB